MGRRVETESDGTRWRMGGEVKGKEANGMSSQQFSVWLGTVHPVLLQSFSPDPHSKKASTRLNWHPRRYKWTRPFPWKTESGFCACAITSRFHSTFVCCPSMRCPLLALDEWDLPLVVVQQCVLQTLKPKIILYNKFTTHSHKHTWHTTSKTSLFNLYIYPFRFRHMSFNSEVKDG